MKHALNRLLDQYIQIRKNKSSSLWYNQGPFCSTQPCNNAMAQYNSQHNNPRFEMSALAIHDSITLLTNIHTAHIHVVFVVTEGWRSRRKLPENVSFSVAVLIGCANNTFCTT